jgi:hypothetical protein
MCWAAVQNISDDLLVKWGGLAANTVAVFSWVIKRSRRHWRKRVFWWAVASLLLVHTVGFCVILTHVEHWRMAWFFVICTLEVIPISAALDWTMSRWEMAGSDCVSPKTGSRHASD